MTYSIKLEVLRAFSSRHEHVEIPLDQFACGIVDVFAEIIIADSLAHTGEFLETVLAPLCVYGQVYQFQGPENSPFDLVLVEPWSNPNCFSQSNYKKRVRGIAPLFLKRRCPPARA